MPSVSVIIATRNRLDMLRAAVASVLCQSLRDLELIVVDDASDDGTTEWLAAQADPRIRAMRTDAAVERSAARNLGLGSATSARVLFLDDDDRVRADALQRLDAALDGRHRAVAAVGAYTLDDGRGNRRRGFHPRRCIERQVWRDALFDWVAPQGRTLMRTDVVRDAGGFPVQLSFAEDRDLWLRVSRLGPVVSIPQVTVDYRIHPGQHVFAQGIEAVEDVLQGHRAILSDHERTIADRMTSVRRLHREGSRALSDLEGRTAVVRFVRAILREPWVLTSPFIRPQIARPLAKAILCVMISRRGMQAVRRVASRMRRALHRDVWSSVPGGST